MIRLSPIHHRQRSCGFTILELLLAVVLMSVLTFLFATSFSSQTNSLALAAEKMEGDLEYIKMLAYTRNSTYGIFFDVANNRYTAFQTTIATPITDPLNPANNLVVDYTNNSQFAGISLTSAQFGGTTTVLFTAQGTPQSGAGIGLPAAGQVVLSSGGQQRTVTVSTGVGRMASS